jgi:hypothetical protein
MPINELIEISMKSEASLTGGGDGSDRRGCGEKMGQLCLSIFPNLLVNRMANTEAGEAMIVAISGDPFAAALNGQSGQECVQYKVALNPHYS